MPTLELESVNPRVFTLLPFRLRSGLVLDSAICFGIFEVW